MTWPSNNAASLSAGPSCAGTQKGSHPNQRKAGLSLLETMITLAILALMAGLAAASFRPTPQGRAEGLRVELAQQVQRLRLEAMQGAAPQFVAIADLLPAQAAGDVEPCDAQIVPRDIVFFADGTIFAPPICAKLGAEARVFHVDWLTAAVGME